MNLLRAVFLLVVVFGCGKKNKPEEKAPQEPAVEPSAVPTGAGPSQPANSFDPLEYSCCLILMPQLVAQKSYNHFGTLLEETKLERSADKKTIRRTRFHRRFDYAVKGNNPGISYKENGYSEVTLNDSGQMAEIAFYDDSAKVGRPKRYRAIFSSEGTIKEAQENTKDAPDTYKTIRTFDAEGMPAENADSPGECMDIPVGFDFALRLRFLQDTQCDFRSEGKVFRSRQMEGDSLVIKKEFNGKFLPVETTQMEPKLPGFFAKQTLVDRNAISGDLFKQTVTTCAFDGTTRTCQSETKGDRGETLATWTTKERAYPEYPALFGKKSLPQRNLVLGSADANWSVGFGRFKATIVSSFSEDLRSVTQKISVKKTEVTDVNGYTITGPEPEWLPIATSALNNDHAFEIAYTVNMKFDEKFRLILLEVVDLSGAKPDQIPAEEIFKIEMAY